MNVVLRCIEKRRSIRVYQDQSIDDDTIETLLKAGFAAPSAANFQPWEFIVTTDQDVLKQLRENLFFGNYQAPLAITVCGNMKLADKGPGQRYWVQDCSAAIENMMIAATSLGLGSVWIGLYPMENKIKPIARVLNIPDYVIPLAVIYFGYPAEEKEPRTQFNEKRVYKNTYDPNRKHRHKKRVSKYEG